MGISLARFVAATLVIQTADVFPQWLLWDSNVTLTSGVWAASRRLSALASALTDDGGWRGAAIEDPNTWIQLEFR